MEKFLEEFVSSLDRLYYTYENYIWKNDDSKLDVLIQDNTISFYLYKKNDVIDEIIFSFDEKEKSMYNYLCVRLLVILLGNVYIYNKDNVKESSKLLFKFSKTFASKLFNGFNSETKLF